MEKIILVFATKWCAQMALQFVGKKVTHFVQKKKSCTTPKTNHIICIPTKGLGEDEDFYYIKEFQATELIEDALLQFMARFQELQEENNLLKLRLEKHKEN